MSHADQAVKAPKPRWHDVRLRDHVIVAALDDHGNVIKVTGQVVAKTVLLDSGDHTQIQLMLKTDKGTATYGTPLWRLISHRKTA